MPPPLVMALCGVIAWGLSRIDAGHVSRLDAGIIGIVIVMTGVSFNVAPKRAFQRAGTTINPLQPQRATHLVQSGLHRWSRNPMYLGHALILLESSRQPARKCCLRGNEKTSTGTCGQHAATAMQRC
ncbi:methyltransferase [Xanthomonas sp. MUS 060]|uniref:methyltransferase family protein n=1 Tax=Xanthomonas sp. MUS 060 TaxID=1588031 RepID=UPI000A8C7628|nr:methyltransferase [Xanthomonas sp. MUS 060]